MFVDQEKSIFSFDCKIAYTPNSILQKVKHINNLPLDLEVLKDGLSSLVLPSQKSMFSQHMYARFTFFLYPVRYVFKSSDFIKINK